MFGGWRLCNGWKCLTGLSNVEDKVLPWSPIYRVHRNPTVTLLPRRISEPPVSDTGDTATHYANYNRLEQTDTCVTGGTHR